MHGRSEDTLRGKDAPPCPNLPSHAGNVLLYIRLDQIISHLFQPHQADQMFDPEYAPEFWRLKIGPPWRRSPVGAIVRTFIDSLAAVFSETA